MVGEYVYNYYKMNADGSGLATYTEPETGKHLFNINNGWVYYIGYDFISDTTHKVALYKMRPDTSGKRKILDLNPRNVANDFINVVGEWIRTQRDGSIV